MTTAEWRAIPGYEGRYEVSSEGEVRSLRNTRGGTRAIPRVLALRPTRHRTQTYYNVTLWNSGKPRCFGVHTLVLLAHVGPRPAGMQAAHWDGAGSNNALSNLRWATPTENMADQIRHGRTAHGERNGTYTHPESRPRGERHWSRAHPERCPRGEDNGHARLTEDDVRRMREILAAGTPSADVARMFGVVESRVRAIRAGKAWVHVTGGVPLMARNTRRLPRGDANKSTKIHDADLAGLLMAFDAGTKRKVLMARYGVTETGLYGAVKRARHAGGAR